MRMLSDPQLLVLVRYRQLPVTPVPPPPTLARPVSYCMVAAFMQLERQGWGNHAVRPGTDGARATGGLPVPMSSAASDKWLGMRCSWC